MMSGFRVDSDGQRLRRRCRRALGIGDLDREVRGLDRPSACLKPRPWRAQATGPRAGCPERPTMCRVSDRQWRRESGCRPHRSAVGQRRRRDGQWQQGPRGTRSSRCQMPRRRGLAVPSISSVTSATVVPPSLAGDVAHEMEIKGARVRRRAPCRSPASECMSCPRSFQAGEVHLRGVVVEGEVVLTTL